MAARERLLTGLGVVMAGLTALTLIGVAAVTQRGASPLALPSPGATATSTTGTDPLADDAGAGTTADGTTRPGTTAAAQARRDVTRPSSAEAARSADRSPVAPTSSTTANGTPPAHAPAATGTPGAPGTGATPTDPADAPSPDVPDTTPTGSPAATPTPAAADPSPTTTTATQGASVKDGARTGRATFYSATGAGACSFDAGGSPLVTAVNPSDFAGSRACGEYLRVTGPKGSVLVKVVDLCPECAAGALDLSAQAFARIADPSAGVVTVRWSVVDAPGQAALAYRYKEGSSSYWCAVQVRDHRTPVAAVDLYAAGRWHRLSRSSYNYFVSADGTGCGKRIKVTDTRGRSVVADGIALRPGVVQRGRSQFPV